jgi:hypothetical protein
MAQGWLGVAAAVAHSLFALQAGGPEGAAARGPYARIAVLRPHDGRTVDFEAGYLRHLDWHRQAGDTWVWHGWTITFGERQRWFVYASFGHSAAALDRPVAPAEDERDNVVNVVPHAQFLGNGLYEFLPALSRGGAVPTPAVRLEMTTVELVPGAAGGFEAALRGVQPALAGETLWYRMVAGAALPRYVRLRPQPTLAALLDDAEQALPAGTERQVAKVTVEVLTLRPALSLGLPPAPHP